MGSYLEAHAGMTPGQRGVLLRAGATHLHALGGRWGQERAGCVEQQASLVSWLLWTARV